MVSCHKSKDLIQIIGEKNYIYACEVCNMFIVEIINLSMLILPIVRKF